VLQNTAASMQLFLLTDARLSWASAASVPPSGQESIGLAVTHLMADRNGAHAAHVAVAHHGHRLQRLYS